MTDTIKSTSFSRLQVFETCKLRAKLQFVDRVPDPNPKTAADRGTAIHQMGEDFVRGKLTELPRELDKFSDEFYKLRELFLTGNVSLEDEWGYDTDWNETPYRTAWLRMKLDALVFMTPYECAVIDYKGLPLNTLLPTPTGWTSIKNVQIGDTLFDKNGMKCQVIGKSKVKNLSCYEITFDDTSKVTCDEEHLWTLHTGEVKQVTALQIGDFIPTAEPLQLPDQELPLDPYVLGIWLADGKHTSGEIAKPDDFIWEKIQQRGFEISHDYNESKEDRCRTHTVKGLRGLLGQLYILGDKQIPAIYLRASYRQRLDLLHGIMDGDGSANHTRKQAVLNTTRLDFAEQVKELLLSLGQRPLISPYMASGFGKTNIQAYAVSFRPNNLNPFSIPRKANKVLFTWGPGEAWRRRVQSVKLIPNEPTQCIAVDSNDHTFLCTNNFIPTHNTGRKFGNEIKHGDQCLNYAAAVAARYPEVEIIHTELWYLDKDEITKNTYSREKANASIARYDKRHKAVTNATRFPPNPNMHSCKYCPYRPEPVGTGHCEWGYIE